MAGSDIPHYIFSNQIQAGYCLHFFLQNPRIAIILTFLANLGIFFIFTRHDASVSTQPVGVISRLRLLDSGYEEWNELSPSDKDDECWDYRRQAALPRPRALDILHRTEFIRSFHKNNITMTTHLSRDRIDRLHRMMQHWDGPIAATILTKEEELDELLHDIERDKLIMSRLNLQLHIVLKMGDLYPVNYLRNVALNHTVTHYVFPNDVDLIPVLGAHDKLIDYLNNLDGEQVLVVPPFQETHGEWQVQDHFPRDKEDLLVLWEKDHVIPFLAGVGECKKCQKATNYPLWRNMSTLYEISYRRYFEPYIVGRRSELPTFSQLYGGRFKDKISFVEEIYAKGYKFLVVPDVFLLHFWHEHSDQFNMVWKRCSNQAEMIFEGYLKNKYSGFRPYW